VFQHSCGHIEEIVPDLIDIGVDVLDPCQPACNDIFAWKRDFGDRLSFMGGLDTQTYLSFGTPDEVESSVRRVVGIMAAGGGYIAAPSHTITVPEANREAMLRGIARTSAALA
jgi:uroporphyrinogen decarboxylase